MTFCYITWSVSPEMFSIGPITLRWYGLLFALSFVIGYIIMQRFFSKENLPITLLDELATYMIIATVVGARLGHVLFYEPESYFSHPLDILKIWEGGLASHGAAVGIMIALYFFARKNHKPYLWAFDRVVIVVALAAFFIRTGNLMNSEIFGKPTNLPWAFIFTRVSDIPRHPTQIYEGLCYLATFFFLLYYYYKKNGNPRTGSIFGIFLIMIFGVRIFIEFLKEPQVGFENNLTFNMGQMLSVPFVILGVYLLLRRPTET
ncbi:MAG: prolipoprotein diacylglyceryl transferase [Bacteroidales bacterium]